MLLLSLTLLLPYPSQGQAKKNSTLTRIDILNRATALNLAPVGTLIPDIVIDLKYATRDNFTSQSLYPPDMPCLLHRMTLSRLKQAQKILRKKKLRLKVWDAYRPPTVHRQLWAAAKSSTYLVPPEKGLSLHCYGVAVDVTLVDQDGQELLMPSRHDEFSSSASSTYTGPNKVILRNLKTLQKAMKKAGFSTIKDEWWHFTNMEAASAKIITAQQLGIQLPGKSTRKAKPVPVAVPITRP
ncbi:MAG: M15 family metallopeptidase [Verrucomicrobiales bacterium]|nr:M15 family metallopeptidase [Verrucomicrobiales bacterium]